MQVLFLRNCNCTGAMARAHFKFLLTTTVLTMLSTLKQQNLSWKFLSVVVANRDLKQLPPRELMTRVLSTTELETMFPNLCKWAAICLLLPMSTVDCERGFSALSRIKTDIRNRLSSRVLNNLMTISVEGPPPEEFPYDKACDVWAAWRNRRIDVTALPVFMFIV